MVWSLFLDPGLSRGRGVILGLLTGGVLPARAGVVASPALLPARLFVRPTAVRVLPMLALLWNLIDGGLY